mmetsp:Transcript_24892/g.74240  ORF Transcript_24892/g.74240 Transcript_24892/m.74240 type:complete len:204 (-) Transcript_24892:710-1321(-)
MVEPPARTSEQLSSLRFQSITVPSNAPLRALMPAQSTSNALTSSECPVHDRTHLPASKSQSCRPPSRQPATARMLSQCTDTANTADGPPQPKSRMSSQSSRLQSLRPPSLDPESALRKRGSLVPQTRCTVTPSAGTAWSLSVVPLGIVSAHQSNCWEVAGTPRLAASCSFSSLMRMSGSAAMRARFLPRMFRTVTWKPPWGEP